MFTHVPANWKAEGQTAWHSIDNNYQFNFLEGSVAARFGSRLTFPTLENPDPGLGPEDDRVADSFARLWAQFAATGDPSVEGLISWPPYEPETDQYLEIAYPLEVRTGFSKLICESSGATEFAPCE